MSGKWGWLHQWKAQKGLCWICLAPMHIDGDETDMLQMSIEHVVPKSRGGGERWNNKLLAHRGCNSARGAPFIWVRLNLFRRAAMKRIALGLLLQTTIDGIDLGCTPVAMRSAKTKRLASGPDTGPSEMSVPALRVTLAELFPSLQHPQENS